MTVIFIVLPLAIVLAIVAVAGFVWAARDGQYDDLTTPALRMLHDDETNDDIPTRGTSIAPRTDARRQPDRPNSRHPLERAQHRQTAEREPSGPRDLGEPLDNERAARPGSQLHGLPQ